MGPQFSEKAAARNDGGAGVDMVQTPGATRKVVPGSEESGVEREETLSLDSGQAVTSSGHHLGKRVGLRRIAINTVLG